MIDEVFGISNFNIFSDDENYYFFRTLEDVDIESIKNKTITDENGNVVTDIEGKPKEVYGFDVPVPALDKEFDLALIGTKGKWYNHKVSVSNPVKAE